MGWQAAAAAGIQAGASVLGTWMAGRQSRNNMEFQNAFNKQMWEAQNLYDSPAEQMKRLEAAGLNPNLVYGNGTVANTSAPAPRAADMTQVKPYVDPSAIVNSALMAYQDVRLRTAQIDNVNAQTENIKARTVTEQYNTFLKDVLGKKTDFEFSQDMRMADWNANIRQKESERQALVTDKMWQELVNLNMDEQLKILDTRYREKNIDHKQIQIERDQAELLFQNMRNDWMKMGVTTSDNVVLRLFVRMMNEQGIKTFDDMLRVAKSLVGL